MASGAAGEEKIGDVGAGDEEEKGDSAGKNPQGAANVFDVVIEECFDMDAAGFVAFRILLFEAFGDGVEVGGGLLESDAVF